IGNGALSLWDPLTGRLKQTLKSGAPAFTMTYSPDGRTLASINEDETTRLWDVTTGREIRALVNPEWETCVAFSPEGRRLIAVIGDALEVREAATPPEITAELAQERVTQARLTAEKETTDQAFRGVSLVEGLARAAQQDEAAGRPALAR